MNIEELKEKISNEISFSDINKLKSKEYLEQLFYKIYDRKINESGAIEVISFVSVIPIIESEKKYEFDNALDRNIDFFHSMLMCLSKYDSVDEYELMEEAYVCISDINNFYIFQEDMGYFIKDEDNNYSITERGYEALKNISAEKNKVNKRDNEYKAYVKAKRNLCQK